MLLLVFFFLRKEWNILTIKNIILIKKKYFQLLMIKVIINIKYEIWNYWFVKNYYYYKVNSKIKEIQLMEIEKFQLSFTIL